MAHVWTVEAGKAVWDGRRLSEWAPVLVAELVSTFDPLEVWLFGSVARGDDDADSDIDLLIVLESYDPERAIDLKVRAARAASSPVPFDAAFTDERRLRVRSLTPGTIERRATVEGGRRVYVRG